MMDTIVSLIAGLGVGSIITAVASSYLDKRKEVELNLNRILEEKYRSMLVFMVCSLDIEKRKFFTLNEQTPKEKSSEYLDQVKEYYYHSTLYSSDNVLIELKRFIKNPNNENYVKTAKAMRDDLWRKKTKLSYKDIILE